MDKCVYFHILIPWRIFYVGIGSIQRAHSKRSRNHHWHNVVNKHGSYIVYIYRSGLTMAEAAAIEIEAISIFGLHTLTNISAGGEASAYGMRHTEEAKKKISLNSGAKRPEIRLKQSVNNSGVRNNMYGKTHGPEAREKIRKAKLGTNVSEEARGKMSLKRRGKLNSQFKSTIHCFQHSGFDFYLTAYDMKIAFGLPQSIVSMLTTRKRKSLRGWSYNGVYQNG